MSHHNSSKKVNYAVIILGLVTFTLMLLFVDLKPGAPEVTYTAAIAILMALWWIFEAIPIGVTSLLPIILFPLMGVMDGKSISQAYINYVIFLFIGGFYMALAIEKWGLHKRIALKILSVIGSSPFRILLGFMLVAAFLSMWMSNTATAMMMLPIAFSVSTELSNVHGEEMVKSLNSGILLGIAYSCSVGGIATLVGTPPNLSFIRIFNIIFPEGPEIAFGEWLIFALPITVIMFSIILILVYYMYKPRGEIKRLNSSFFKDQYINLGPITKEQKRVFILFCFMVLLWVFRKRIEIGTFSLPGWSDLFNNPEYFNDGTIAIFVAVLLFIIPSTRPGEGLINWRITKKIPWNIVLLFGGGFALAQAFIESGLSEYMGSLLASAENVPSFGLIGILSSVMTFLTEFTSNTATTEMLLPVVAGLSEQIAINPLLLMIPVTLAASMAFMFPIATPPNAIVFGTGRLTMKQMAKTGIILNIVAIIILTVFTYFWGTLVFGIDTGIFPEWAL